MNAIKVYLAVAVISFLFGGLTCWTVLGGLRDSEITEAQRNLQEATEYSQRLRDRLAESRRAVDEVEAIAERRQRELEKMGREIQRYIERVAEREALIDSLTEGIGSIGGGASELRSLAEEGERLVGELLQDAN